MRGGREGEESDLRFLGRQKRSREAVKVRRERRREKRDLFATPFSLRYTTEEAKGCCGIGKVLLLSQDRGDAWWESWKIMRPPFTPRRVRIRWKELKRSRV